MKFTEVIANGYAIHCGDREYAKRLLIEAKDASYATWVSGDDVLSHDNWDVYKENTCYKLLTNHSEEHIVTYESVAFYESKDVGIIDFLNIEFSMPREKEFESELSLDTLLHSHGVGNYMRRRASAYGLHPDAAYIVGLLHDVGYIDKDSDHAWYGSELCQLIGVKDSIKFAVEYHDENPYTVVEKYGEDNITPMFVLLLEANLHVDSKGRVVNLTTRLSEFKTPEGINDIPMVDKLRDCMRFVKDYQVKHNILS